MLPMTIWSDIRSLLDDLASAGLLRRPVEIQSACGPRVSVCGREVVCLCSNDYLSLASDPATKAAAAKAIEAWGVGAGASRLVSGTTAVHVELERALAEFEGAEAALVTSTGWMANGVAVRALAGKGDLILCDKLNHASILDAARLSGASVRTFPHRDVGRAEALLKRLRAKYRRCLIATDSLFSMDGDLAPLGELAELKDAWDAQLLIDEAHATGVIGPGGRGVAELLGVDSKIDVTVGTLSKAIGALGGFVAGPRELIDLIRNTGRAYIYTTALPPAMCAAAIEALRIIRRQPQRRKKVLAMAEDLRARLAAGGLSTGLSKSQIVPVVVGKAHEALAVSGRLLEEGFLVPAIRPPTVPRGTSRLRCSIAAGHLPQDITRLGELLVRTVSN